MDEENPIKANERKAKSISGSIERECQVFMMALLQSNAIITNTIKERAYWELPEKRRYFSIHFDTLGYVTIQFNTLGGCVVSYLCIVPCRRNGGAAESERYRANNPESFFSV